MRFATLALLFCAVIVGGCRRADDAQPEVVGQIEGAEIDEASGLAASRRNPGLFWTHNDSGGQPVVYAINRRGRELGRVRVKGVGNDDWEDIASFTFGGKPCLLIGDVGDNHAERAFVLLHVIEEPERALLRPGHTIEVAPLWSQRVRYSDGARDCESVAVDDANRRVYLLSKREFPAVLYQANLGPEFGDVTATPCGKVASLPQPSEAQKLLPAPRGRYLGWITAMDFSDDGTWAAVLTYGHIAIFERSVGETWPVALSRDPSHIVPHEILQAEAVCAIPRERAVLVTGEGVGASLYRWRWDKSKP